MQINFGTIKRFLDLAQRAVGEYQKLQGSKAQPAPPRRTPKKQRPQAQDQSLFSGTYPGDYEGHLNIDYSPHPNGTPDPGEVVWSWVPFEEDHSQGKDRPLLLVGRDGPYLLALMLTSKDRNNSTEHNPHYLDIGTGLWDKQGRPSEVKLNRVIRLLPETVRREGAVMDERTFNRIKKAFEQANN